jgi:protein-disulfide isomerase
MAESEKVENLVLGGGEAGAPAIMADANPTLLDPAVDVSRDHILGPADAEMTLVEYGSYACPHCHAVHEVVEGLPKLLRSVEPWSRWCFRSLR